MERDKALHILKALADGIDPGTGEPFADGSPYQRADTVRALCTAVYLMQGTTTPTGTIDDAAAGAEKAAQRSTSTRTNAGRAWTEEEELRLAQAFDSGRSIEELAQEHQRSRLAIEARLAKLGKVPEPAAGMRFPLRRNAASEPSAAYR
jgi:hypothetical protein